VGPFEQVVAALNSRGVRFVVIGVSGANYYATSGSTLFVTADRDLYLPPDPVNALAAWDACESVGLELWSGPEPLDTPRDLVLARAIVARQALVRASDGRGLEIDLTLVMAGFEFDEVWSEKRVFRAEGVEVPVARLRHIVESKAAAGRPKDRLFLATHEEALRELLREE
jgi:predicted nucleotidyltransferase